MRSPVYRNLDKPFQIMGFNILELTLLCVIFVGGGELLQLFDLNRVWAFLLTAILAFNLFWVRRSLGDLFIARLIRFLKLPSQLNPKLFINLKRSFTK